MNGPRIERLLWGLLVLACLLHLVSWSDASRRNFEFLPDMVVAVPYESQSSNPNFGDGKTLQAPPEGTIARGYAPLRAGELLLDTTTKWEELPPDQVQAWDRLAPGWGELDDEAKGKLLRRGEELFGAFCATCHGLGGLGDGEVTKRGVPPPPSLVADNAKQLSDGRIFRIITGGRGNMAAYATQIEREDRWKVLRFLRTLQTD